MMFVEVWNTGWGGGLLRRVFGSEIEEGYSRMEKLAI
jgi:hypothetical protein